MWTEIVVSINSASIIIICYVLIREHVKHIKKSKMRKTMVQRRNRVNKDVFFRNDETVGIEEEWEGSLEIKKVEKMYRGKTVRAEVTINIPHEDKLMLLESREWKTFCKLFEEVKEKYCRIMADNLNYMG